MFQDFDDSIKTISTKMTFHQITNPITPVSRHPHGEQAQAVHQKLQWQWLQDECLEKMNLNMNPEYPRRNFNPTLKKNKQLSINVVKSKINHTLTRK